VNIFNIRRPFAVVAVVIIKSYCDIMTLTHELTAKFSLSGLEADTGEKVESRGSTSPARLGALLPRLSRGHGASTETLR
jgi:hypothetical protein